MRPSNEDMRSSNEEKTKAKPSRLRSAVDVLVNPHIGETIQPLRDTHNVFVSLLAWVFVSHGMISRDLPGLNGPDGPRLTLSRVLGAAWRDLTFSKEKIPQILLFCAILVSLGFGVVAIAIFFMILFAGKAHAQTTASGCGGGYFTPCDSTQDVALGWINYIFNNQPMFNYLNQYGQVVPQSQAIQQALISALGFYSDAILVVAAVILFYHLVAMVVETAHHGVVMGKRASQVWAPIRLVVAIGLLVPIAGGLNSGQYIVIKVAEWGSNMASQVWSVFVTQLANESYAARAASAPYARKTAYDAVMMEACAYAWNAYMHGAPGYDPSNTSNPPPACVSNPRIAGCDQTMQPPQEGEQLSDGSIKYAYEIPNTQPLDDQGVCGHYTFPPLPTTNETLSANFQSQIQHLSQSAYDTLRGSAKQFVEQYMPFFIAAGVGGQAGSETPQNTGGFEQVVATYQDALQNGLQANSSNDFSSSMKSIASVSGAQGWVSAGAWFNTVARTQSELMDTTSLIPATQAPTLDPASSPLMGQIFTTLATFNRWLGKEHATGPPGGNAGQSQQQQLHLAVAGIAQDNNSQPAHLMDGIFAFVDWMAQRDNVWQSVCDQSAGANTIAGISSCIGSAGNTIGPAGQNFTLGVQFTGANPFAEIAYFGHAQLKAAYEIFDVYMQFLVITGLAQEGVSAVGKGIELLGNRVSPEAVGAANLLVGLVGKTAGGAREAIGTVLGIFVVMFFTTGMLLAFFLPLIPFFRFMFNVLTWIVSLLEAVIAVPLIALAHLNPEGDGLAGPMGRNAYHFVFNIFLRPVLMVFGLIVGTIIFFLAASYLNMLYMQAVVGTGGLAHGHLMLSRFVYTFLYVFVLFTGANSAFHMIDWLPEHAMKWMGGQSLHFQKMGDPDQLQTPITVVSGIGGQQLIQGVGKLDGVGALATRSLLKGHTSADAIAGDLKGDVDTVQKVFSKSGSSQGSSETDPGAARQIPGSAPILPAGRFAENNAKPNRPDAGPPDPTRGKT